MKSCRERTNFVFIKCMKCATETIGTAFRRFGYIRNLTFVTPVGSKLYLGWPCPFTKYDYRPLNRSFNIIMEHSIYNKMTMQALMPVDTVYVTMIREPFSHFTSVFNYFSLKKNAGINSSDPITEYLHHIDHYEQMYKNHVYCIPDNFSLTKNLMSHCVGMPLGFPAGTLNITADDDAVERYIDQLDHDFSLVMIVEYFHESLILFKRIMCWTLKDIIFWTVNVAHSIQTVNSSSEENVKIYKKWSTVDYKLYDHFNKTFWQKIRTETSDFFDEVKHFITIEREVVRFCSSPAFESAKIAFNKTLWNEQFEFNVTECKLFGQNILQLIQKRLDEEKNNPSVLLRKPGDRNGPLC